MRKFLLLVLLLPLVSTAQTIDTKKAPLKKANGIVVINTKSAEENFKFVMTTLADKNIEIQNSNKEVFQIKSGSVNLKRGITAHYLFNCRDNKIIMSGMFKAGHDIEMYGLTMTDSFEQIVNKGMAESNYGISFTAMNEFAKTLGTEITYQTTKIR